MSVKNTIGRPQKTKSALSKTAVHKTALALMDEEGEQAVTFRALAQKLGVTAMAVKYHVGSRRQMLKNLVSEVFVDLGRAPMGDSASERVRNLLHGYCETAIEHTGLVQCVLKDPSLISDELLRLTENLRHETQALNSGDPRDVMLNLLVDYTHGFVFAAANAPKGEGPSKKEFMRSLDWLLDKVRDS